MNILLLAMMKQEYQPVIKILKLEQIEKECEICEYYMGKIDNKNIFLVVPKKDNYHEVESIGTESAYLQGYLGIKHTKPDLIINFGSCGAVQTVQDQFSIGDICFANERIPFIDRTCLIDCYDKYVKGNYPILNQNYYQQQLTSIGVKPAKVGTRNSFIQDHQQLLNHQCSLVEMESAAFARISHQFQIQFIAIKSISDIHDITFKKNQQLNVAQQFHNNLDQIASKLANTIFQFISLIQY